MRRLREESGMALLAVLVVILVLSLLGGLVLHLSGQEQHLSTVRYRAAQSLNIAEGGAWAARAALMALVNADPQDAAVLEGSVTPGVVLGWYAGGNAAAQAPLAWLNHVVVDGGRIQPAVGATAADGWVALRVNWALASRRLKLEFLARGSGEPPEDVMGLGPVPANALGEGSYRAVVVLSRRLERHGSCAGGGACYVHRTGPLQYEVPLDYRIVSDGHVDPQFRRRVVLRGSFRVVLGGSSFAQWALFTHVHTTPQGGAIWFTSRTSFDGPVHTNGEFRFAYFPKFGTPDVGNPCDPGRIGATTLTSTSRYAWFNNGGSPVRLQADENVDRRGRRIDAPVLPDCTPGDVSDDHDNPAAQFTRGFDADPSTPQIDPIVVPPNSFNQKGISVGRDPADTSPVTNLQVRRSVPELRDSSSSVPSGIYVPAADSDGDCITEDGDRMLGGIYVQGNLTSLTFGVSPDGNLAVYTFRMGSRTVTVTVDRARNTTTVQDTSWPGRESGSGLGCPDEGTSAGPRTVTLQGVPNGVIYVEGDIGRPNSTDGLSGTLEEKEQVTVVASGTVYISGHIQYERPPDPYDPGSNPQNLLGVYSSGRDIVISRNAPADLVLHGVFMAGQPGVEDGYNSSVRVEAYDSISCRGAVRLLGGLVEEYYGPFGTFSAATGQCQTGYGREFVYDRRMGRGFSPPFFPTTTLPMLRSAGLAGSRPEWREGPLR
jgi:Tfp pilus assembly protein PilX